MTATKSLTDSTFVNRVLWTALGVTLVSQVLSHAFAGGNQALLKLLSNAFGMPSLSQSSMQNVDSFTSLCISSVVVFLISIGACFAGNLSPRPRSICCLQLLVVSIFCQWIFVFVFIELRPLVFVMAIALACSAGYLLRMDRLNRSKQIAGGSEHLLRKRELLEARLQMVKQDEVDRRMLAADLHDQVLNDLKVVNQQFRSFKDEPSEESATAIEKLLQQSMNGVRDVMDSLSPAVLEHLGFSAALEDCMKRASERSSGFKVRFKNEAVDDDFSDLNLTEQTLLYRLVQECGTNICKHAQASVRVVLSRPDAELLIRVSDNGKGIPSNVDTMSSRGFQYMRQRADLIGATIAWSPGEENKGTTVEIRMPVKKQLPGESTQPVERQQS
jgi:signal transduction histidine kinase